MALPVPPEMSLSWDAAIFAVWDPEVAFKNLSR
jgi:hypothetical protein